MKACYYLQYTELKHVDLDSKETRRAASTLLPHVTRYGTSEDYCELPDKIICM